MPADFARVRFCIGMAVACGGLLAAPATAQPVAGGEIALEVATDGRERGLSWSDGKPALTLSASLPVTYDLTLEAEAATLRDSARHGGAELRLSFAPRYTITSGGWILGAGIRGNVFTGRSSLNYLELTGELQRTIGPARLVAGIDFAPSQDAIGGHNLHARAQASAGIPGTALTAYAGIGHTSGARRDDPRAWRLRPGGSYTDHHLGIEHSRGRLSVGIRYSGTSIDAPEAPAPSPYYDRHHGSRLLATLRYVP